MKVCEIYDLNMNGIKTLCDRIMKVQGALALIDINDDTRLTAVELISMISQCSKHLSVNCQMLYDLLYSDMNIDGNKYMAIEGERRSQIKGSI